MSILRNKYTAKNESKKTLGTGAQKYRNPHQYTTHNERAVKKNLVIQDLDASSWKRSCLDL